MVMLALYTRPLLLHVQPTFKIVKMAGLAKVRIMGRNISAKRADYLKLNIVKILFSIKNVAITILAARRCGNE